MVFSSLESSSTLDVSGREVLLADLKAIDAPSHFNKHEGAIPA